MTMRSDGRANDQIRPIDIRRGFTSAPAGSVLWQQGGTIILATASIVRELPPWMKESQPGGWVTANYVMLPGSTPHRKNWARSGHTDSRGTEIERMIGRSLRAVVDLAKIGPHTITIDCQVLQADGGTRTASVTGAYVALFDALVHGAKRGLWGDDVLLGGVAAVSVGIVGGRALLDLDYHEDVEAEVDCNLVMTNRGEWVEVQCTGERSTFGDRHLAEVLSLGRRGIERLMEVQRAALEQPLP